MHLAIADPLRGDRARAAGGRRAAADLLDQPAPNIATTRRSIRSRSSSRGRSRANTAHARRGGAVVLGLEPAERPAGRREDLQGPDDPPAIVGWSRAAVDRVERRQPGVQRRVAEPLGLRLQPSSELRVGPRPLEQARGAGP